MQLFLDIVVHGFHVIHQPVILGLPDHLIRQYADESHKSHEHIGLLADAEDFFCALCGFLVKGGIVEVHCGPQEEGHLFREFRVIHIRL